MNFSTTTERDFSATPQELYAAWTEGFERWFAAPGTAVMRAVEGEPFYFATEFESQRHPHYGRFLRLIPGELVEMTWVNAGGTQGAETIVKIELQRRATGTHVRLTHSGFPTSELRDRHRDAWPQVLQHLDEVLAGG